MKRFIATLLCMILCLTMIPSFFASAAPAKAAQTAAAADVSAQNDETPASLEDVWKFFTGLWETILGPVIKEQFWPALKEVLSIVPFKDFLSSLGNIFGNIFG